MNLKVFYVVLNFLILIKAQHDIIQNVLDDMEILKKLEFSNSELIAEAKDFEHADLSYVWYDKNVNGLYWNTTINDLVYKRYGYEINILDLLKCKIKRMCYLNPTINKFLGDFHNTKEFDDFIASLHNVIKIRINILKQIYFY